MRDSGKTASFAALKFLLEVGYASAFFAANSLLVSRVGAASLLPVYLAGSLLSIALSSLFYALIDRYSRRVVFSSSFLLLGGAVAAFSVLAIAHPDSHGIIRGMRVLFYAVFILTELEYWLAASFLFSNREAKRLFPLFVSLGIAGDVVGGLVAGFAAARLGTAALPLVWGVALALAAVILVRLPFPSKSMPHLSTSLIWGEIQGVTKYDVEETRTRSPFANPLTVMLAVFWIYYSFICYGTDYVFNAVAGREIPGEDALTAFFGRITAVASAAVLAYQLLVAPKLTERMGLVRVVFLLAGLMAGVWVLYLWRPTLTAIALVQGTIFFFLENAATSSLNPILSVFPERIRGRIRIFTEGYGRPLGIVILLGVAALASFKPEIGAFSRVIAAAALVFLLYPFFFRRAYETHLVRCLRSSDQALVINAVQALGEPGKLSAVPPLAALLQGASSRELARSAVLSLAHIRKPEAFREIVRFLAKADETGRADAVKAIGKKGGRTAYPYLVDALGDPDARVRANVVEALGLLKDDRALQHITPFLDHPNRRLRLNAAVAVCRNGAPPALTDKALAVIDGLYASDLPEDRRAAVYAIGELALRSYEASLLELLTAPDDLLKVLAAVALARLRNRECADPFARLLVRSDAVAEEAIRRANRLPPDIRSILLEGVEKLSPETRNRVLRKLDAST